MQDMEYIYMHSQIINILKPKQKQTKNTERKLILIALDVWNLGTIKFEEKVVLNRKDLENYMSNFIGGRVF